MAAQRDLAASTYALALAAAKDIEALTGRDAQDELSLMYQVANTTPALEIVDFVYAEAAVEKLGEIVRDLAATHADAADECEHLRAEAADAEREAVAHRLAREHSEARLRSSQGAAEAVHWKAAMETAVAQLQMTAAHNQDLAAALRDRDGARDGEVDVLRAHAAAVAERANEDMRSARAEYDQNLSTARARLEAALEDLAEQRA